MDAGIDLGQLSDQVARLTAQVAALVEHLRAPAPAAPPLLTCAQVGEILGVSEAWVQTEALAGRIAHRRIGAKYRFTRDDVDELIEKARRVGHDPYALSSRQLASMNRRRVTQPTPTPRQLSPYDTPIDRGEAAARYFAEHDGPHARIVCPGSGQSMPCDASRWLTCMGCQSERQGRLDRQQKGYAIPGRHIKYVPADSEEARTGRLWSGKRPAQPPT